MKTIHLLLFLMASLGASTQTIYTNVEWSTHSGEPDSVPWSHTIKDNNGYLYIVGNRKNVNGNTDIYLAKLAADGQVVWEQSIDHNGGDDYGAKAVFDNAGNIVIAATVWESAMEKFNYAVLKFQPNGTHLWTQTYNGTGSGEDIPTAIAVDGGNNIFVTGGSPGTSTGVDYATLKYKPDGTLLWTRRYDYNGLDDAATGIVIKGTRAIVNGGSQSSVAVYDGASVQYGAAGAPLGVYRSSLSIGINRPVAIVNDAAGNFFIAGWHALSPTDKRWTIAKLDSNLNEIWHVYHNPSNGSDEATDMCIGPDANLWVSGHVTNDYGTTDGRVVRFSPASGTLLTETSLSGQEGNATILKLENNGSNVAFVGERWKGTEHRLVCGEVNQSGKIRWMREPHSARGGRAMEILSDYSGRLYVTGQTFLDNTNTYLALQITTYEHSPIPVIDGSEKPLYLDNELLIRFSPDMMKENIVSNRDAEWGNLSRFVKQEVLDSMNTLVGFEFGRQKAMKIFRGLTPADSMAEARDGTMVRQQPFWTCLKVALPAGTDEQTLGMDLEQFFPLIFYTDLNFLGQLNSVPNDAEYQNQGSLHAISTYPNAHVNIEEAWEIETGIEDVKVGVFDTGIEWDHEDFGYVNGQAGSSRVVAGWDFENYSNMLNNPHADSGTHGTSVAGIIGAARNNSIGIAGIAGGHDSTDATYAQKGVSLYGLRVTNFFSPVLDYVAEAIVESSKDDVGDFNYGLDINNFSIALSEGLDQYTDTNINLLRDAIHQAYKNGVIQVAGRANDVYDKPAYPATYDDQWIINVGGTGNDGHYITGTNGGLLGCGIGRNLDIAAPASITSQGITRTLMSDPLGYNNFYTYFGGTSGATPHVSGTAALLLSYLNDANFTLAQEDVEWIIQLSATDVNGLGYDDSAGYGRLNAGAALKLVEKPNKKVRHYGTSTGGTCSVTPQAVGISVNMVQKYFKDGQTPFNAGAYEADVYKISCTVSHNLAADDSVVHHWPRSAGSTVFPLYNAANGNLLPHEITTVQSFTTTQATLEGYVYHLKDAVSGAPLGWIPEDTSAASIKMEYSILTHKKAEVIEDTTDTVTSVPPFSSTGGVQLFPNPAKDNVTILLRLDGSKNVSINLHTVNGTLVKSVYEGTMVIGENTVECPLMGLASGIYFMEVLIGKDRTVHRLTKQ